MILADLRDHIRFESGIKDSNSVTGWLDGLICEECRMITNVIRYDELYVPSVLLAVWVMVGDSIELVLPADMQHLDPKNIKYGADGDFDAGYFLQPRGSTMFENVGPAKYFTRVASLDPLRAYNLRLFPDTEIQTAGIDGVMINYWKYLIPPGPQPDDLDLGVGLDRIIPELKQRCIARARVLFDSKNAAAATALATRARSTGLASTRLSNQNGGK